MPNWCNNTVEITHSDRSKMDALVAAVNEGKFCNFAIPVPESLHIIAGRAGSDENPEQIALVEAQQRNIALHGHADWYSFCTSRWGTKWDVEPYDTVEPADRVTFGFDSAWSPPIGVYAALEEQGYEVRAYYYEPGMGFAGIYEDGHEDDYDLSNLTSEQAREELPEALDEMMGISETIANYEDENENE